jgi:hypothetical protein
MEEKKDKKVSLLDKDDLAKSGIVAGSSAAAVGGGIAGLAAMSGRILRSNKVSLSEKRDLLEHINRRARNNGFNGAKSYLKHMKTLGGAIALTGVPVLGVSAYMHHKYKKQMKDKEKIGLNNNQQN